MDFLTSWPATLRVCFTAIVITACAITFMMLTAQNPSADDFWKAIGFSLAGFGTYYLGKRNGADQR